MKNLKTFLAIFIAIIGAQALQAQTSAASTKATDYTSKFSNSKEAWGGTGTYTYDGISMVEYYNAQHFTGQSVAQTATNLPIGIYSVEIYCHAHCADWECSIVASDGATDCTILNVNGIQTGVPIVNNKSHGTKKLYTLNDIKVTDGTLSVKVVNNKKGANWITIRANKITYIGPDKAMSEEAFNTNYTALTKLNAEAPMPSAFAAEILALKAEYANVAAADLTQEELDVANGKMQSALAAYDTNVGAYSRIRTYIDMTKVFDEASTASYEAKYDNREYTLDDVEPVRQELNVMRFNAASALFTNKIEITGWTGSMGERSDQHWSGTTVAYKDANSWNDTDPDALTAKIKLPKGNYVLKVAGRAHADAALTLKVLGQTITFHGKGDTGYGIDTKGNANFSPSGTYANNGTGRGWEWEFLKFTLDAEQTVTLEVNSGYNNIAQVWTSFGDMTLWMDDDTYVAANGHAIDAPLAEAKALALSTPMGKEMVGELTDAIALCDTKATTPQELNTQVATLEEAIAKAKAWVEAYGKAKQLLVSALERFEADYNNAELGAIDYMCTGRWAAALEMVKSAALAKDITDSYESFAGVAADLNAALDAATASVAEYVSLNEAIKNADRVINSANIGDQPFQKPLSAIEAIDTLAAREAYNAAIIDGEELMALIATLKGTDIELNAPAEGDVFKVAISASSWDFSGKPLTFADNGTDGINMFRDRDAGYYAQTLMLKKIEGNKYTISTIAADGTELYVSTGTTSGNGTTSAQIRLTDDVAKALGIEVIATSTEGLYNLKNTEANALIGSQDGNTKDKASLSTVAVRNNFTIAKAAMPAVCVKGQDYWGTMILPFAAEIPEGMTIYSCIAVEGEYAVIEEALSIEANTPYLVCSDTQEFEYTFTGFGSATQSAYEAGALTGTYTDLAPASDGTTYVLQSAEGSAAFCRTTESALPTVLAYTCYLSSEAEADRLELKHKAELDNISNITSARATTVFDLSGRRVTAMEKGCTYIVNGKKVRVK